MEGLFANVRPLSSAECTAGLTELNSGGAINTPNKRYLPQPRVPKEYRHFIGEFEGIIEAEALSSIERLYFLEQFEIVDERDLVKSSPT